MADHPPSADDRSQRRLPGLTALRALAVTLVVVFHFFPQVMPGGFVGVDIFFVLSGFLMATRLGRGHSPGEIGAFYRDRFLRILPPMVAVSLPVLGASLLWLNRADANAGSQALTASLVCAANHHFSAISSYFDRTFLANPFTHLWSLSLEFQFYILLPLFYLTLHHRSAILAGFSVVAILSLAYCEWCLGTASAAAYFLLPSRIWEFLAGAALGHLPPTRPTPDHPSTPARLVLAAATACLLASALLLDRQSPFPGLHALPVCAGALVFMIASERAGLHWPRWILHLGDISYSLYLWHWPVWVFATSALLICPGPVALAGAVAISVLLATLTYRLVEQPVAAARHGRYRHSLAWAIIAITVAALAASGLAAAHTCTGEATGASRIPTLQEDRALASRLGIVAGDVGIIGEGRPRFLAWGDSHLAALAPGLAAAATTQGVAGIVVERSSSPPLFDVDSSYGDHHRDYRSYTASVKRMLTANGLQLDTVILVARWREYSASDPAAFRSVLLATLQTIQGLGLRTVIIGQPPEIPFSAAKAITRSHPVVEAPSLPYNPGTSACDSLLETLGAPPGDGRGPILLRLDRTFCDPEGCIRLVNQGEATYLDEHHLSPAGVRLVQVQLRELIGLLYGR